MEGQRRLMDYMTKNPQDAAKAAQALQTLVTVGATEARLEEVEQESQQKEALAGLIARYNAAVKAATDPIFAKQETFRLHGATQRDVDEFLALSRQADQEYEKLCAQWWKGGPFHAWLVDYRKFLIQEIPRLED